MMMALRPDLVARDRTKLAKSNRTRDVKDLLGLSLAHARPAMAASGVIGIPDAASEEKVHRPASLMRSLANWSTRSMRSRRISGSRGLNFVARVVLPAQGMQALDLSVRELNSTIDAVRQDQSHGDLAKPLNSKTERCIFGEGETRPVVIVVGGVRSKRAENISFAEVNDVIGTFSAERANQPLRVLVLPGQPRRRRTISDAMAASRRVTAWT